jgi:hypothetical protein
MLRDLGEVVPPLLQAPGTGSAILRVAADPQDFNGRGGAVDELFERTIVDVRHRE